MNIALSGQLSALRKIVVGRRPSVVGKAKYLLAIHFIQAQKCSGGAAGAFGFLDGGQLMADS
jgi:hypothetical protein